MSGSPARFRIAENLRHLRRSHGWTQAEVLGRLAEVGVNMSKASYSALERSTTNGRSASFSADLLAALAVALGVTPNDLFGVPTPDGYDAGWHDGRRAAFARVTQCIEYFVESDREEAMAKLIAGGAPDA